MKTPRLALAALLALPLGAAAPPAPEALASQARSLAGNLMLSLQGELFAAMKDGGPIRALDVCRVRAPEIATATATIDAFTGGHDNPAYDTLLIDYVWGFVAKHAGAGFNPHVTTGVAPKAYLDQMLAEPFASFSFSPAGAAVYQLGQFATGD